MTMTQADKYHYHSIHPPLSIMNAMEFLEELLAWDLIGLVNCAWYKMTMPLPFI